MKFKVSSALKDHIGKELITNDNVAIFELVKNSYDAGAKNVKIVFKDIRSQDQKILIIDNGSGMSKEDLENKWLFLAYSDKKNYKGAKNKRFMAGSKGLGRFSCDRLGSKLKIYTKIPTDKYFNLLKVDWDEFEKDQEKEFREIEINLEKYDKKVEDYKLIGYSGTIVEINKLRSDWDWKKLQNLKRYLQRLINPLQIPNEDSFEIELIAEDFKAEDYKQKYDYDKVNGKVENIVYEKLKVKTTAIECNISENGKEVLTKLNDKGIDIFELKEENKSNLKDIKVKISFLNAQAKSTFKKLMGVDVLNYGNLFVFKNGFRVLPYGDTDDDWLRLNLRKAQGYARNLGTREILGRIEINDSRNEFFKEVTSRSEGLIDNEYFKQLKEFVLEFIIKRLEKYVVGAIDWDSDREKHPTKEKKEVEEIKKDSMKIIKQIAGTLENKNLWYNKDFLEIVEKKTIDKIPETIKNLENLMKKEKDKEIKILYNQQIKHLKLGRKLEKEKQKEELEHKEELIKKKEEEVEETKGKLKKVETENIFLKSTSLQDKDQIISLFHHIGIHSDTIKTNASSLIKELNEIKNVPEKSYKKLEAIAKLSQVIYTISKIGFKGGITEEMENGKQDLVIFIEEFVRNICIEYYETINIEINNRVKSKFVKEFIPFEMTYIIDNFISNSKKAQATKIQFLFLEEESQIALEIIDNGKGLDSKIKKIDEIFERNVSTTRGGAGLGLYDARKIINKLKGKINAENLENGFKIRITIPK